MKYRRLKQSPRTKSPRPLRRRDKPGMRLRTGVKAGTIDAAGYGDVISGDVIFG